MLQQALARLGPHALDARDEAGLACAAGCHARWWEHTNVASLAEHARVDHEIPLVDFLKAFRIAQLELWDHLLEWAQSGPEAEQTVLGLVSHVMRTIEAGSSAAATTYIEAQQYDTISTRARLGRLARVGILWDAWRYRAAPLDLATIGDGPRIV